MRPSRTLYIRHDGHIVCETRHLWYAPHAGNGKDSAARAAGVDVHRRRARRRRDVSSDDEEQGEQQATSASRVPEYLAIPFSNITGVFHCVARAPRREADEFIFAWNRFASAGMLYSALPSEEELLRRSDRREQAAAR